MQSGYSQNFATVVMATGIAHMMGPFQFAAIRAFLIRCNAKRVVAAPHVALGR